MLQPIPFGVGMSSHIQKWYMEYTESTPIDVLFKVYIQYPRDMIILALCYSIIKK